MAVEREGCANPMPAHKGKRDAIGEAHALVRVLAHPLQRRDFVVTRRRQHIDYRRGKKFGHPIGGITIAGASGKPGRELINDVVAREDRPTKGWPNSRRLSMVLIAIAI